MPLSIDIVITVMRPNNDNNYDIVRLDGCIVLNEHNTLQYSPEAVSYPCTSKMAEFPTFKGS